MRIKGEKLRVMETAFAAVVKKIGKEALLTYFSSSSNRLMVWDIWRIAWRNLQYDDSHPLYQNGTWQRIVPPNLSFDLYSDGDNDTHIETALIHIAKKCGLLPRNNS